MIFGGLFVNTATILVFIRWMKWISCVFYAFQALVGLEFDNTPGAKYLPFLDITLDYWTCVGSLAGLALAGRLLSLLIIKI